jgi:xylan 1,4-beta-xylosidase
MKTIQSTPTVDLSIPGTPFNRYFLEGIGSCHSYLTLREDWREHARLVQREIGFKAVRTHGIFHDLVGIYNEVTRPKPGRWYNFQNLDKIYDFWLGQGLKPYVELSFMPNALASGSETIFQYRANVTPPKDMGEWNALIRAFAEHLIERYGLNEVLTWNFEVWNEPDLIPWFWAGDQAAYFDLYANTVRTLKAVDPRLKVGGPATSRGQWVPEMLEYCISHAVPLDFISTHHYCADAALVMGKLTDGIIWRGEKAMPADVRQTRETVQNSTRPNLEVHYTEWNVSPIHEDCFGKDSEFTAAFVLQTIKDVAGLADKYMLWAISDIFEESGPGLMPFSGKYGLVNLHGIKKPVFHAFRFLSRMYAEAFEAGDSAYVTRNANGDLRVLTWNYCEPTQVNFNGGDYELDETLKEETLCLSGIRGQVRVKGWLVDREHGNALRAWQAIESPQYLTAIQVEDLKRAAEPALIIDEISDCAGELRLVHILPPSGMLYYEIEKITA